MMDFEITKIEVPREPAYLHNNLTIEPGKIYYLGDFAGYSRRVGFGTAKYADAVAVYAVFKGGLVDIKQNFSATTDKLTGLFPQLTGLEFYPAWSSTNIQSKN